MILKNLFQNKLIMDILTKNKEITESCMVELEQLKARYAVEKKKITEQIAQKSTASLETVGDSGEFPHDFFLELTKLKVEFENLNRKEKEEIARLMGEYNSKMSLDMRKDLERLKVYEKHLTKPVITWDYLSDNHLRDFPLGNMKDVKVDAENWRLNFLEVITLELEKL